MINENGFVAIDDVFRGNNYEENGIMFSECNSIWGDDDDCDDDCY